MYDHRVYHDATVLCKPDQPSKPSTYWAAVLYPHVDPATKLQPPSLSEEDYLWIKCNGKIIVKTIADQLKARHPDCEERAFQLVVGLDVPGEQQSMRDLDVFDDHVIAFEAVWADQLKSKIANRKRPEIPAKLTPALHAVLGDPTDTRPAGTDYGVAALPFPLPSEQPARVMAHSPIQSMSANEQGIPSPSQRHSFNAFYDEDWFYQHSLDFPDYDERDLRYMAWKHWIKLDPSEREYYDVKKEDLTPALEQPLVDDSGPMETAMESIPELDFKDQFNTDAIDDGVDNQQQVTTQHFQLQSLVANANLEILEASVEKGVEFLDELKKPLVEKLDQSPDAAQWMEQINRLQKQAAKSRTIIGVVGNTGAGKSSVINALLDEERLLPTNTMRACTAVVSELSYNYTDSHYRAKVEFITADDWEKELNILFQDLLDSNGEISRECTNQESDAGVAYAKIRAVYPKKTKEEMANSSIERMLKDVSHILGKTRNIDESDSLKFYKKLQQFVDSKEKNTGKKDKKDSTPKEMEFWPLIKVVRVFVRAPALATGAVIVDLPGVHDANAARAAVAQGYMKQCTGLWIVAPIIRAVDDKAAKNLLGEHFRRQLKMDGGYSSVTFICSKTDDISLTEASDSLGLNEQNEPLWKQIEQYTDAQKKLKNDLKDMKETKETYGEIMADADEQVEIWEELKSQLEEGKTVYAPSDRKKKRKKSSSSEERSSKRRKGPRDDDDDDFIDDGSTSEHLTEKSDDEGGDITGDEDVFSEQAPLTEEDITTKINALRATKKESRRQRSDLENGMRDIKSNLAKAKEEEAKLEAEISRVCIEGRNAYSKGAIQQDFAAGMKELDQEMAEEEDEANFNPENDLRDYNAVAASLPVFCVSSRGYQKLKGRLQKDAAVPGFTTVEETEMPQLRAHCKQLTVAGRTENCKRFMTNLSQLLNSLTLWATNDGSGANLTDEQRAKEAKFLEKSLDSLENGLEKLVNKACNQFKEELGKNIFDRFEVGTKNATDLATVISDKWGAAINRENRAAGGLYWSTYKAICRREGIYNAHNWSTELLEPLIKHISTGWERTFTRLVPAVMNSMYRDAGNLLRAFHKDIDARASRLGMGIAGLAMLKQQLAIYEDIFKEIGAKCTVHVNGEQKEINREFTPVIAVNMAQAYAVCVAECGTGSYMRMKNAMRDHIEQKRSTMFKESTDEVRKRLKKMVVEVEEMMMDRADEVFVSISRDYRAVLGTGDVNQGEMMPKWQRTMRRNVIDLINTAERTFKQVAGVKVEDHGDMDEMPAHPDIEETSTVEEAGECIVVKSEEELDILTNNQERLVERESNQEAPAVENEPIEEQARNVVSTLHGAPPVESVPDHVPTIPKSLLDAISKLPEPARTGLWLHCCFEEDRESDIPQMGLWNAYRSQFQPTIESYNNPATPLTAVQFIEHVRTTFSTAYPAVVQLPGEPMKFIYKGIRYRATANEVMEHPASTEMEQTTTQPDVAKPESMPLQETGLQGARSGGPVSKHEEQATLVEGPLDLSSPGLSPVVSNAVDTPEEDHIPDIAHW